MSTALEGLGPRPARLHHDPTTQLSTARAGVLDALSEWVEPVTVQRLAQRLGQHANTVREHLDALVRLGLAQRSRGVVEGRGRPPLCYLAIPPESARPQVREYAMLASVLAAQLAKVSPDPEGDAIAAGMMWGARLGAKGPMGAEGARARTMEVLQALGFDPMQLPDGSVDLRQCPLLETAKTNFPVVCGVHLGLVRALYVAHEASAQDVRLEPFAKRGACVLRLPDGCSQAGEGPPNDENPAVDPRAARG